MKILFAQYLGLSSVTMFAFVLHAPTTAVTDEDDSRQRKRYLEKSAIKTAAQLETAVVRATELFKLHGAPTFGTKLRSRKSKNKGVLGNKKAKRQVSNIKEST